jgi:hypothetical protein
MQVIHREMDAAAREKAGDDMVQIGFCEVQQESF